MIVVMLRALAMWPFAKLAGAIGWIAQRVGGFRVLQAIAIAHHPGLGFVLRLNGKQSLDLDWQNTPAAVFRQLHFHLDKIEAEFQVKATHVYVLGTDPTWRVVLFELSTGRVVDAQSWQDRPAPGPPYTLKEVLPGNATL